MRSIFSEFRHDLKANLSLIFMLMLFLILIFGGWTLFFDGEFLSVFIYAPILYALIYILILKRFLAINDWWSHWIGIGLCYFLLSFTLRSSPLLQFKEFEWTHPNWQTAENVQIIDMTQERTGKRRDMGYMYMSIIYTYEYQGKNYTTEQSHLVRQYHMLLTDNLSKLRGLSQQKLENTFKRKEYVVLVNPARPEESIYFYTRQWIDLRLTLLGRMLFFTQIIIGCLIIGGIGTTFKNKFNLENKMQGWSKPKKYLFIAVIFIVGWSILFFGWILFMVIQNNH